MSQQVLSISIAQSPNVAQRCYLIIYLKIYWAFKGQVLVLTYKLTISFSFWEVKTVASGVWHRFNLKDPSSWTLFYKGLGA